MNQPLIPPGEIAVAFEQLVPGRFHRGVESLLATLTRSLDLGAAYLFISDEQAESYSCIHLATVTPAAPTMEQLQGFTEQQMQSAVAREPDAPSLLAGMSMTPLMCNGDMIGVLALVPGKHMPDTPDTAHDQLAMIASALANAEGYRRSLLVARASERQLRRSLVAAWSGKSSALSEETRATADEPFAILSESLSNMKHIVPYAAGAMLLNQGEELALGAYVGPSDASEVERCSFSPRKDVGDIQVLGAEDATQWLPLLGAGADPQPGLIVPLISASGSLGCLVLLGQDLENPTEENLALLATTVHQLSLLVDNLRLRTAANERLADSEQRARVAESLRDLLAVINSNRPLDEILDHVAQQIAAMLSPSAVAIYRILHERGTIRIQASYGLPDAFVQRAEMPLGQGALGLAIKENRAIAVPDTRTLRQERDTIHLEGSEAYAEVANWKVFAQLLSRVAALLAMPLYVAGEPYGGVILHYPHARQFTGEEIALAEALVSHAALAVENASLHSQVEQAAVASERARLAHELHDSVSQALYGIGLGVRTTLTLLSRLDLGERNREALQKPLDYAMSLAEGGLAEMRALIFGLRPDSLEKEGLVAAMERQAAAISARHELAVETAFCSEPEIAIEAKEALYRIAQEALNNVIKHAHAQNVVVTLAQEGAHLFLRVSDNGHGFDAEGRYPGHVGLQTMRERLSKFRGALTIESQPNAGTTICASLPVETA